MKLSFYPYQLRFKFPFTISRGTRYITDVVFLRLEHDNHEAWGEAALPPYLSETQATVIDFFKKMELPVIQPSFNPAEIFEEINKKYPGNMAAKAALDMALWELKSKIEGRTIIELLGIKSTQFPLCTYTIGICPFEEMKQKVEEANNYGFELFKIKLDGRNDEEMIGNFKKLCPRPFAVDLNQGWNDILITASKIEWLRKNGCVFVEQPLPKEPIEDMVELKKLSVLPLYADEGCQRLSDIEKLKDAFHGINIKLMKCGGISEGYQMIKKAREFGLKILIGCMSESSVGCTAAAQLTPLADYADLDGPYLVANDPFEGMKVEAGRIAVHPVTQVTKF